MRLEDTEVLAFGSAEIRGNQFHPHSNVARIHRVHPQKGKCIFKHPTRWLRPVMSAHVT